MRTDGDRTAPARRTLRAARLAVVLVLALGLAGCGGTGAGQAAGDPTRADGAADATQAPRQARTEVSETATAPEELTPVTMQLGWIASNNQLGEVVAMKKDYFAEEGIALTIEPGGPNIDGVANVASGSALIGQVPSSPALMLAVSQGIPIQQFAAGASEHPFAYFSMPDTPLESAEDLAGKVLGTQQTAEILLDAMLLSNDMTREDLAGVEIVGSDITPLLTGQVDVWTGWLTNTGQLDQLPDGYHSLRLWDSGVQLYAQNYYATRTTVSEQPELLEAFVRAAARGWIWANDNPEEAVDLLLEEYPNLTREAEVAGTEVILEYYFPTDDNDWGAMDPQVWQRQLDLWDSLGQFEGEAPTVDEVMTLDVLEATQDARAR